MRVTCEFRFGWSRVFTDGRVYQAYQTREQQGLRVWTVRDDKGHERVILPEEPCAHLPCGVGPSSDTFGRFVPVEEA